MEEETTELVRMKRSEGVIEAVVNGRVTPVSQEDTGNEDEEVTTGLVYSLRRTILLRWMCFLICAQVKIPHKKYKTWTVSPPLPLPPLPPSLLPFPPLSLPASCSARSVPAPERQAAQVRGQEQLSESRRA